VGGVRLDLCYLMAANRLFPPFGRLLLAACFSLTALAAAESHGVVKAGGLPVPGATVTAVGSDKKFVTTTDDDGFYSFPNLEDGTWKITVEALGFVPSTREIGVAPNMPGPEWDLRYQTLEAIANPPKPEAAPPAGTAPAPAVPPAGGNAPAAPAATEEQPDLKKPTAPARSSWGLGPRKW